MELFKTSFIDVLEKTIEITPEDSLKPLQEGYISSIELLGNEAKVFIVANEDFLRLLSAKMVMNDCPNQEMLIDISKELANLVVGCAKVIAKDRGEIFQISTPIFYGISSMTDYTKAIHFKIDDTKRCSIFMKA